VKIVKDVIIVNEILILTGFALLFSVIIAILEYYIAKHKREEIDYTNYLPGYNCGACGYGSCKGLADELKHNPAAYIKCRPLKGDDKKELESVLGIN
jgi:Na+-translocating ferredoxin:NAD+ oxidoreductase RNF subunit RnfB